MAKNPNKSKIKQPMKLTKGEEVIEQYSIPALANNTEESTERKTQRLISDLQKLDVATAKIEEKSKTPVVSTDTKSSTTVSTIEHGMLSSPSLYIPHPREEETFTEEDLAAAKDERKKIKAELRKYWRDFYAGKDVKAITEEMLATADEQQKLINKAQYKVTKISKYLEGEKRKQILNTLITEEGLSEEQANFALDLAIKNRKPFQSVSDALSDIGENIQGLKKEYYAAEVEQEEIDYAEEAEAKRIEAEKEPLEIDGYMTDEREPAPLVEAADEVELDISQPFLPSVDTSYPFETDIFYYAVMEAFTVTAREHLDRSRADLLNEMFSELLERGELYAYAKDNYEHSDTSRVDSALWVFTHYHPPTSGYDMEDILQTILDIFFTNNRNINTSLYEKYKAKGEELIRKTGYANKSKVRSSSAFDFIEAHLDEY